ncbi:MAG: carbonic anhydrase family protein [Sulfuricurvum sp.]|nr:carbonic anhydrase family protein [Sulfuricurvum sp.]
MKNWLTSLCVAACLMSGSVYAEAHHGGAHWNYDDHGPAHWGEFGETCAAGKAQSPINILTNQTSSLEPSKSITLAESVNSNASIADNGHAIQATIDNGGKLTIDGIDYKLLQFHFHGKSEEMIDGKQYDLVAHMVHKSADGNLAVVAVLFNEGKKANPMVQKVLDNVGKTTSINPSELLPKQNDHYFHFMGSLTTPPCSENVKWYVMKEVQSATKEQITAMRHYYDHNYRPVQPLNGRAVESK